MAISSSSQPRKSYSELFSVTVDGQSYALTNADAPTPEKYAALSNRAYQSLLEKQEGRKAQLAAHIEGIKRRRAEREDEELARAMAKRLADEDEDDRDGKDAANTASKKPKVEKGAANAPAKKTPVAKVAKKDVKPIVIDYDEDEEMAPGEAGPSVKAATKEVDAAKAAASAAKAAKAARKAKQDAKSRMRQRRQAAAETKEAKKKRTGGLEAVRIERIAAFKENGATDPDDVDWSDEAYNAAPIGWGAVRPDGGGDEGDGRKVRARFAEASRIQAYKMLRFAGCEKLWVELLYDRQRDPPPCSTSAMVARGEGMYSYHTISSLPYA